MLNRKVPFTQTHSQLDLAIVPCNSSNWTFPSQDALRHEEMTSPGSYQKGPSELKTLVSQVNGADQRPCDKTHVDQPSDHWKLEFSRAPATSPKISRVLSQEFHGGQSHRGPRSATHEHTASRRTSALYSTTSHGSVYPLSSTPPIMASAMSPSSASALCNTSQHLDLGLGNFTFPTNEDLSQLPEMHAVHGAGLPLTPFNLLAAGPQNGLVDDHSVLDSPSLWDTNMFLGSRKSSPGPQDHWTLPPQMLTPTTNSSLEYSPIVEAQSPGFFHGLSSMPDLSLLSASTEYDTRESRVSTQATLGSGSLKSSYQDYGSTKYDYPVRYGGRTASEPEQNARDHELYQKATPNPMDGLYHCPWEGQSNCQHKAEKLKCNYEYDILYSTPYLTNLFFLLQ